MLTFVPFCFQVLTRYYPKYVDIIKDIVTARSCNGNLDYRFDDPRDRPRLVYLVSLDHSSWDSKITDQRRLLEVLETVVEVVKEANDLAGTLVKLSDVMYFCRCGDAVEARHGILANIFQVQLCVARLSNVRIRFQPDIFHVEGMALDGELQEANARTSFRHNAAVVMEGQVGAQCPACLQRMWEVLDALERKYITLRQHQLRPRRGSLMDLLFGCPGNYIFWSLNPIASVSRLLIDRYQVNMRETRRCKKSQHMFAVRQSDADRFEALMQTIPGALNDDDQLLAYAKSYLEPFRKLLGLPDGDKTPVWQLLGKSPTNRDDAVCPCNDADRATTGESQLVKVLDRLGNHDHDNLADFRECVWKVLRLLWLPTGFASMRDLLRRVSEHMENSKTLLHKGHGEAGFAG